MIRVRPLIFLLAVSLAVAAGCTAPSRTGSRPAGSSSTTLTIMEFNIEYGGELVEWDKTVEAAKVSGADVVAIEEAEGNTGKLAASLGWKYYDARRQLVSKYPILAPPDEDPRFAYIQVRPGEVVAVANVHLPSWPYGPNQIKNKGASKEKVLRIENRVRVPKIQKAINALLPQVENEIPSFLVGDFNSPSHRDWTEETVGRQPWVKWPLAWPVTVTVEDAGFVDSYRAIHPDPVEAPGLTWPAKRPKVKGYNPPPDAAHDRIDYIFSSGPATVRDSFIVGEEGEPVVDVAVDPWPTDHRGVVSSFKITPGPAPVLVGVSHQLYDRGEPLEVTYHSPGTGGERIAVVPAGEEPAATGGTPLTAADGTISIPTGDLTPGAYHAVLTGPDGELARIAFWVKEPGAGPQISTAKPVYRVGEPITVEWSNAPANRWDWIGIYRRGANPKVSWYILWEYTGATVEGKTVMGRSAHGPWPLEPGDYSVYLLKDDGYDTLAEGAFTVRD